MSLKTFVLGAAVLLAPPLLAGFEQELSPELKLKLGADVRTRYEYWDRELVFPDGSPEEGGAVDYLRVRTRIWTSLELEERISLNVRLVNRFQHYFSNMGDPNNTNKQTWQAPDEVIFDQLNITVKDFFAERLTLTVGRQDLLLGNFVILSEGTPFDQGRTVYYDGIRLNYKDAEDTVDVFVFYDEWKDPIASINDRNRRLRVGDVFTAGAYWTHAYSEALKMDLYYMYNDVDDDYPNSRERIERGHPFDANNSLHTVGGRLFGRPVHALGYSAELAKQGGRSASGGANQGMLADLRLKLHAPEDTPLTPTLGLQYFYVSGDKGGSSQNQGWNPVMSELPLWRGDLLAILYNGVWTNMHFVNAEIGVSPAKDMKLCFLAGGLFSDERGPQSVAGGMQSTGGGDYVGTVLGAYAEYKINRYASFLAEFSWLRAGDYYANGHNSSCGRLELVIKY